MLKLDWVNILFMQSFLIASKDPGKSHEYALDLCKKNKINDIDINLPVFEKTVGIEDVRNIQRRLFLKPIKSDIKAVIIEACDGLTIEAQNSLLKILEEPPENTIIIVTVLNKNLMLSTIISRCKVIEIPTAHKELEKNELSVFNSQLSTLISGGVEERLKLAEHLGKTKDETIAWLEQMIIIVRKNLIDLVKNNSQTERNFSVSKYLNILKNLEETYTVIKTTNVNRRFALENLFLSFN